MGATPLVMGTCPRKKKFLFPPSHWKPRAQSPKGTCNHCPVDGRPLWLYQGDQRKPNLTCHPTVIKMKSMTFTTSFIGSVDRRSIFSSKKVRSIVVLQTMAVVRTMVVVRTMAVYSVHLVEVALLYCTTVPVLFLSVLRIRSNFFRIRILFYICFEMISKHYFGTVFYTIYTTRKL